jgi:Na+/melibiose symporter-like transporter
VSLRRLAKRALYPLGSFGFAYTSTLFTQWIVYRHAAPGSAPGAAGTSALFALALFAKYVLEGVASPCVGAWTDRFGGARLRRTVLVAGAIPLAVIFAALWGRSGEAAPLLLVPLYGLIFTLIAQPYSALLAAVSPTPAERNQNALASAGLAFLGAGAAFVAGPHLAASGSFALLGLSGAASLLLTVLIPALFLEVGAEAPAPRVRRSSWEVTALAKQRGVAAYLAGNALMALGGVALMTAAPFVVELALARSPESMVTLNAALVLGVVLAAAAMSLLARRFSPGRILAGGGIAGGVVALGAALSLGSGMASASLERLFLVGFVVLGMTLFVSVAAPPIIVARFVERDGRNREGMFFGLSGLATNLGNAGGAALTSVLLASSVGAAGQSPLGARAVLVASGVALLLGGVLQGVVRQERPAEAREPAAEASPALPATLLAAA